MKYAQLFICNYESWLNEIHYNWNRYYDPRIGRYITSDPIGLDGGLNTFGYVNGNPLNLMDIDGLKQCSPSGCRFNSYEECFKDGFSRLGIPFSIALPVSAATVTVVIGGITSTFATVVSGVGFAIALYEISAAALCGVICTLCASRLPAGG